MSALGEKCSSPPIFLAFLSATSGECTQEVISIFPLQACIDIGIRLDFRRCLDLIKFSFLLQEVIQWLRLRLGLQGNSTHLALLHIPILTMAKRSSLP